MNLTKRELLTRVGKVGGAGAMYFVMQALGHMQHASSNENDVSPVVPVGRKGKSVLVLGAGIAGLAAAFELTRAGYDCRIIEASQRVGGRSLTLRRGSTVSEHGGVEQNCRFDDDLYFNAGPARIPSSHKSILRYCKEFEIGLEVFINDNRSTLFQDPALNGGAPVESRQVHHDSAGFVAELLSKAINKHLLDDEILENDRERLLEFLRQYGDLTEDYSYAGGQRIGYEISPGAFEKKGRYRNPLRLADIVNSRFWDWKMHFESEFNQQTTMFQPVGGMDQITNALAQALGDRIKTGTKVEGIFNTASGVRVLTKNGKTSEVSELGADFCICTIPLSVLRNIKSNLSKSHKEAVRSVSYAPVVKLGIQTNRRFWEEDEGIYGGISYLDHPIAQIWYPCSGYLSSRGVLLGAYNFYEDARQFSKLNPAKRSEAAMAAITRLHPQITAEAGPATSIAWHKVPFIEGAWAEWSDQQRSEGYSTLSNPDHNVYFAGEHMSWLPGWQEGAVLAAHRVAKSIDDRVRRLDQ